MNVGYRPIAKKGAPALERSRLSHVFQNYVRPETLAAANAPLVARQVGLPLAQAWGGGLVAVDGMRFVVPVPAAFARPNRKIRRNWEDILRVVASIYTGTVGREPFPGSPPAVDRCLVHACPAGDLRDAEPVPSAVSEDGQRGIEHRPADPRGAPAGSADSVLCVSHSESITQFILR